MARKYQCDVCGTETANPKDWWAVGVFDGPVIVLAPMSADFTADDLEAFDDEPLMSEKHYCGIVCASKGVATELQKANEADAVGS
jgi:hypothetical protein